MLSRHSAGTSQRNELSLLIPCGPIQASRVKLVCVSYLHLKKTKTNPYNQGKNITSNLLFGDTHFKEGIDQQIFFWLHLIRC